MRLISLLFTAILLTAGLLGCSDDSSGSSNTPANRLRTVEQAFKGAEIAGFSPERYPGYHYVVREPSGTIWYVSVYSAGTIYARQRLLGPPQAQPAATVEAAR